MIFKLALYYIISKILYFNNETKVFRYFLNYECANINLILIIIYFGLLIIIIIFYKNKIKYINIHELNNLNYIFTLYNVYCKDLHL